jgi:hypothetical protein
MIWLYQIPTWSLALLVISGVLAYAVGGVVVVRPWVRALARPENDTVGFMLSIAGVAYAVLLAMIAVGAWNGASAVDVAIQQEANALASVARGVGTFRPAARDHFRQLVGDYIDFVVRYEWPALERAAQSPRTELASETLAEEIVAFEPVTPSELAMKPSVIDRVNEFEDARRLRILTGERGLNPVTWFVVTVGGLMTLAFVFFFRVESLKLHILLSTLAGGMIGITVFLIIALDHPLWGRMSVKPEALQQVLRHMDERQAAMRDTAGTPVVQLPAKKP